MHLVDDATNGPDIVDVSHKLACCLYGPYSARPGIAT